MSLAVKKIRVNPQNPRLLFLFRRVPNDIDFFERNQPVAYHQVDFFHRRIYRIFAVNRLDNHRKVIATTNICVIFAPQNPFL